MKINAFVVYSDHMNGSFVCGDFSELVRALAVIFPQGTPLAELEDEVTITIDTFDQEYIDSLAEYDDKQSDSDGSSS